MVTCTFVAVDLLLKEKLVGVTLRIVGAGYASAGICCDPDERVTGGMGAVTGAETGVGAATGFGGGASTENWYHSLAMSADVSAETTIGPFPTRTALYPAITHTSLDVSMVRVVGSIP